MPAATGFPLAGEREKNVRRRSQPGVAKLLTVLHDYALLGVSQAPGSKTKANPRRVGRVRDIRGEGKSNARPQQTPVSRSGSYRSATRSVHACFHVEAGCNGPYFWG